MATFRPNYPIVVSRYRFTKFGPVTIERHEHATVASCSGSPRIEIRRDWGGDIHELRERIRHGIDVVTDGAVTGQLIQHEHGTFQSHRRVELVGTTPDRYPAGAYFRARGIMGMLSLESPDGKLITPRHPRLLTLGMFLRLAPIATPELLALYAAATFSIEKAAQT